MIDLLFVFVLLFNIVTLSMSVLDDYVISKLFLKKHSLRKGQIIYFNDYSWYKAHYDFSVVEYEEKENTTCKVFVRRKKDDKIGDVITIASNEFISLRPEVYKKMDTETYEYIYEMFCIVISILYLKSEILSFITIKEFLVYLLVLIVLFFGYIGLYYLHYKIIVHSYFKR